MSLEALSCVTLNAISPAERLTLRKAYAALRHKPCSRQHTRTAVIGKTFGPTGAAKALYAILPNLGPLWDSQIRTYLRLNVSLEGYCPDETCFQ